MSNPKRPKDNNQRAKLIVDIATGETPDNNPDAGKNPKSVSAGKLGGLKGVAMSQFENLDGGIKLSPRWSAKIIDGKEFIFSSFPKHAEKGNFACQYRHSPPLSQKD